jgi:type VI secretion system secreted protein VgrG
MTGTLPIRFHSAAVPDGTLVVTRFNGTETLSTPFRFAIELVSLRDDLDLAALLRADARLDLACGQLHGDAVAARRWETRRGVLARIERCDGGGRWTRYRAELVPRWWRASLSRRSRLFMDCSAVEIAERVLRDAGLPRDEWQPRLSRVYAHRDYVVQHDESDLDFVARLLEHEGIYHRCDHGDERTALVLGDSPETYGTLQEPLPFHALTEQEADAVGDHWHQPGAVQAWGCRHIPIPAEAQVSDHNWRSPDHDLRAASRVPGGACGVDYRYGEGQRDVDESARLARIHAEALACTSRVSSGRSNAREFTPGLVFTLSGHPVAGEDGRYVITEVRHRGEQQLERGAGGEGRTRYENSFTCIPGHLTFHPPRVTPRPRISGVIHAVVDAAGAGEYAELDDQGRYRVRLPLDLDHRAAGGASRPVRMSQPYAGPGMGMHFPLHKGTEVLIAHINGDPDRPVIAGAVPNPANVSVVTSANRTQGVLRSASGNELRFDDTAGAQEARLSASRDLALSAVHDRRDQVGNDGSVTIGRDRHERIGRDQRLQVEGASETAIAKDASMRIGGRADLRIGGHCHERIDGDAVTQVGGKTSLEVGRDLIERIDGERHEIVAGSRTTTAKRVVLEAREEIVLTAGQACITLRADGTITISGSEIALRSSGSVRIRASSDITLTGARLVGN